MDDIHFKKTEGRLYRYYEQLKKIEFLKKNSVKLYKEIEQMKVDLKNLEADIDYFQPGTAQGERVQTSSSLTSYAERALIKAFDEFAAQEKRLKCDMMQKKRKILQNSAKIREIENQNTDLEDNISMLNEENKRFLEYMYGEKMKCIDVAYKMNLAKATAYRKRNELLEDIARWCNII